MFSGGGASPALVIGSAAVLWSRHSGGATMATAVCTVEAAADGAAGDNPARVGASDNA